MNNNETEDYNPNMESHFSNIADRYRTLRNTDMDPIIKIKSFIPSNENVSIIDIGSGTGRYDELILEELGSQVHLTCVDKSAEMIDELILNLSRQHYSRFKTLVSEVEQLPFEDNSYDFTVSFNAFHHFNLFPSLKEIARITKNGGCIFIYTRTPIQNAKSIWGKFFPKFNEKEDRLYSISDIELVCDEIDEISLSSIYYYNFLREASLEDLIELAKAKHYSTFSFYEPDEFTDSLNKFINNIGKNYNSENRVNWTDGNVLYVIKKNIKI